MSTQRRRQTHIGSRTLGAALCVGLCAALLTAPRARADHAEVAAMHEAALADMAPVLVDYLVEQAGAPLYEARVQAERALATTPLLTLHDLEDKFVRGGLDAEQRVRLLNAIERRFQTAPRAGMGIRFGYPARAATPRDLGLRQLDYHTVVGSTTRGFHVNLMLEQGDVILAVNGESVIAPDSANLVRFQILSHDPGDSVQVTVRRGADLVEVPVILRSYAELGNTNPRIDPDSLRGAWDRRLGRLKAREAVAGSARPFISALSAPAADWEAGIRDRWRVDENERRARTRISADMVVMPGDSNGAFAIDRFDYDVRDARGDELATPGAAPRFVSERRPSEDDRRSFRAAITVADMEQINAALAAAARSLELARAEERRAADEDRSLDQLRQATRRRVIDDRVRVLETILLALQTEQREARRRAGAAANSAGAETGAAASD